MSGIVSASNSPSSPTVSSPTVGGNSNRDYALVQSCLLSIGLSYVLVNLLADVVYRRVNPRMRG